MTGFMQRPLTLAIQRSDCDVPRRKNPKAIFLPFGDQTGSNAAPRRASRIR